MARLSPFFPAMLVFIGALFVAAGGFWASWRQSNFNMEIRAKNDQIARLQQENANTITGGDSFAYAGLEIYGVDGSSVNAHNMPDDLLLVPVFINKGHYPLYDVSVRFSDIDRQMDLSSSLQTYNIGNMAAELSVGSQIRLLHHEKNIAFIINFAARNGLWTQFLRMLWVGDGWAAANKVVRGTQEIYRNVSDNYPRQQDGNINWEESSAKAALRLATH
jgi:hypothetical protein